MDTGDVLAEAQRTRGKGIGLFGIRLYIFGFIRIIFLVKHSKRHSLQRITHKAKMEPSSRLSSAFSAPLRDQTSTLHGRDVPLLINDSLAANGTTPRTSSPTRNSKEPIHSTGPHMVVIQGQFIPGWHWPVDRERATVPPSVHRALRNRRCGWTFPPQTVYPQR